MRSLVLLLASFAVAALVAAPIPKSMRKPHSSDRDRLQGRWIQTAYDHGKGQQNSSDSWVEFEDDSISTGTGAARGFNRYKFTLDESTTPKHLTVHYPEGQLYVFSYAYDYDGFRWIEKADPKTEFPPSVEPGPGYFFSRWTRSGDPEKK